MRQIPQAAQPAPLMGEAPPETAEPAAQHADPSAADPRRTDPFEACLLFLLEHHGQPMSLAALRAGVARPEQAWTLDDFVEAIESLGFTTETLHAGRPPAPSADESLVLLGAGGKVCVLLAGLDASSVEVYAPGSAKPRPINDEELMRRHGGSYVRVQPPQRRSSADDEVAQGRRGHWFWGPTLLARSLYTRAGIAAVLTNVFALATSIFSMIVYDRVIPNNAIGTLYALLLGVAIVFASDFAIKLLRGYFLDVAGSRADMEIADALFDHVLDLDMRARRGSTGGLASVLKEYESVRELFTSTTLATLIDLPFALLFVLALYLIGGPMAWVPVVAIPLMLIAGLMLQPSMKRQAQVSQEDSQTKQAVLVETLAGLETIKALGAGAVLRRRWQQTVAHQSRIGMKTRLLGAVATNWSGLIFMISQVAVVTVGVFLAADGKLGPGAIVAGSILCGRAVQPMAQLTQLLLRMNQGLASYRALSQVMAMPREHHPARPRMAHDRLNGTVELRDVSFRYPGQKVPILDAVSLRVEAGERVAVIGRVGSGKTTLVKLLLGLHTPDDGMLMVGGNDVRQIDPADLRRNMGTVLQDLWLLSGTLRQNIALGGDRPSDAEVLRVAGIAGVDEFAGLHPDGYQMRIGESGEGLSGGQRQMVALARALIGDPPILVLDEPTSALDPTAERLLLQRLKLAIQGKTLILITHKPSMLELVDRVVVIERGRIVAQGPKDAVLRSAAAPAREAT